MQKHAQDNIQIKRLICCDQPHNTSLEQIYWGFQPKSPHNSKHLFDIYSLTHLFWSLVLTLFGALIFGKQWWVPYIVVVVTILFEIFENLNKQIVRYRRVEVDNSGVSSYRGDSIINIIGDIIFNILGSYLGYTLSTYSSIGVLISTFTVVTKVVGINYWIEFFEFLGINKQ